MSHRRILSFLSDHKYLSAGGGLVITALLLAGLSTIFSQGSVVSGPTPLRFDDCSVNQKYDISGCGASTTNWLDNPSQTFWVGIPDSDYQGTQMESYVPFLYYNGFRTETEDRVDDIDSGEVKVTSRILNGFEKGSTCKLTADLAPGDGGSIKYRTSSGQEIWVSYQEDYEDMESDEVHTSKMMSRATVSAESIKVTENGVYCSFSAGKLIEKGLNVDGEFLEYGGDPLDWHHASLSIDFEMNRDGDPVLHPDDECPGTPGLEAKNGCPNQEVVINSVEGPRNVTVGESVQYSVSLANPDNDSLQVSWSNGETGRTATYKFNSTGEKTVEVSVSDGFTTVSESVAVNVEEKSFLESFFGLFDGLWNILWYGG